MMYKTHISSSLAMGSVVSLISGYPFLFSYAAGITLGSLLPDIDEPKSYIGKRSFGLSIIIKRKFGHRGVIHSLLAWSILTIIIYCSSAIGVSKSFALGVSLGYLFHLMGDYFSVSSIPLLYPYQSQHKKRRFSYITGGRLENIIYILTYALFLIIFFTTKLYITFLNSTVQTIIEFIKFIYS
jgi:inner membrane protein